MSESPKWDSSCDPINEPAVIADFERYTAPFTFRLPLMKKFEHEGFANVQLDYYIGDECWNFRASRGRNQGCQTPEHVKMLVARLAGEANHEIANGLIVALVVGDQLGAAFRLRELPQQPEGRAAKRKRNPKAGKD